MGRVTRVIGTVVAALVVIAIALPFFIDANQFRPRLETELSTALGRAVKLGNLKLSLWSGAVTAANLSISDDPAFSQSPPPGQLICSRRKPIDPLPLLHATILPSTRTRGNMLPTKLRARS